MSCQIDHVESIFLLLDDVLLLLCVYNFVSVSVIGVYLFIVIFVVIVIVFVIIIIRSW